MKIKKTVTNNFVTLIKMARKLPLKRRLKIAFKIIWG